MAAASTFALGSRAPASLSLALRLQERIRHSTVPRLLRRQAVALVMLRQNHAVRQLAEQGLRRGHHRVGAVEPESRVGRVGPAECGPATGLLVSGAHW